MKNEGVGIYARVSQPIQKANGDLERQVQVLKEYAINSGVEKEKISVFTDVGSGLNDRRKGLWKMMHATGPYSAGNTALIFRYIISLYHFSSNL